MTTLQVSLPASTLDFVEAQTAEGKYATVAECIAALLLDAKRRTEAERDLEAKLLEGVESEASEMTGDDWAELERRVWERHAARQSS